MVYSSEVPSDDSDVTLLPLANSELARGSVDKLAPQRDFRVRILPVLGPLSAFFSLHIATHKLHKRPLVPRIAYRGKQANSLLLTTTDIGFLYDDFALGRSIVPPHAACVRAGIEEVSRTMSRVFAMPGEDAVYEEIVGLNRVVSWSSEEVWSVEADHVAQFRIAQARHFRNWALQ
ncbi:hypothetical protein BGW80DRAFT_1460529 [Lactifluus volemus]|nr:hypothetical protein BGW80DRAFT_1460529 [Lactifluus volemus]